VGLLLALLTGKIFLNFFEELFDEVLCVFEADLIFIVELLISIGFLSSILFGDLIWGLIIFSLFLFLPKNIISLGSFIVDFAFLSFFF